MNLLTPITGGSIIGRPFSEISSHVYKLFYLITYWTYITDF